jgi:hypothetical protein
VTPNDQVQLANHVYPCDGATAAAGARRAAAAANTCPIRTDCFCRIGRCAIANNSPVGSAAAAGGATDDDAFLLLPTPTHAAAPLGDGATASAVGAPRGAAPAPPPLACITRLAITSSHRISSSTSSSTSPSLAAACVVEVPAAAAAAADVVGRFAGDAATRDAASVPPAAARRFTPETAPTAPAGAAADVLAVATLALREAVHPRPPLPPPMTRHYCCCCCCCCTRSTAAADASSATACRWGARNHAAEMRCRQRSNPLLTAAQPPHQHLARYLPASASSAPLHQRRSPSQQRMRRSARQTECAGPRDTW